MTAFGQLVIGPAGSGKTTYTNALATFLPQLERPVTTINLDFGNISTHTIDVRELITLEDAMEAYDLGPNGGMLFCMSYLLANIDWLLEKLKPLIETYLIFDTPGQVELTTHDTSLQSILRLLSKEIRLVSVHLVDLSYTLDAGKWIGGLTYALMAMHQLELPSLGILSKCDLLSTLSLPLPLDFYTQVQDLTHLTDTIALAPRYEKMTQALAELVTDFNLVSFHPLVISDKQSVMAAVCMADKAGGFVYKNLGQGNMFESAEKWNDYDAECRRVVEMYELGRDGEGEDGLDDDGREEMDERATATGLQAGTERQKAEEKESNQGIPAEAGLVGAIRER
jgi:GPN-loop GTPase